MNLDALAQCPRGSFSKQFKTGCYLIPLTIYAITA
jgi:hypothetical protein